MVLVGTIAFMLGSFFGITLIAIMNISRDEKR